ncbi:hypothetical protein B9T19_03550 [Ignatzschineria sp. F8392]|uniref:ATP-binding protein n=1 Tax=Ignatzschineria sp. F8392 TaxID=1980117 RepID=UPI000B98A893|nr:ATP-binding protein [Ignatzschineria sp. F8392]OYQ81749.1 hypothetical protein B9T19_03550 [Ignatzschineria sp. F8392]
MAQALIDINHYLDRVKPEKIDPLKEKEWVADTYDYCDIHGEYVSSERRGLELRGIPQCPQCAEESRKRARLGGLDGIAKRFQRCSFDNFQVVNKQQSVIKGALLDFAKHFSNHLEMGTPVLLLGGVGTGKTHLASAVANKIALEGYDTIFRSVNQIIRSMRDRWGQSGGEEKLLDVYRSVDLLIIDEVGVQAGSDNERNILFDIINSRYEEMKPTIMISNLDLDHFTKTVGLRIASRIQHDGLTLVFDWKDYRKGA